MILEESIGASLKSESTTSLFPPEPKFSSTGQLISPNSSSVSLPVSRWTSLPSPPLHSSRNQSSLSQPGTPPGYLESKRPATTITYTFSPQTIPANSMILSAPSYASPPQDAYYISVNMNCFTPSSWITTIRRGSWDGEIVGDFELGLISWKRSTVYTRGSEHHLYDLLDSSHRLFKTNWTWKIMDVDRTCIYWDDTAGNNVLTCFSSRDRGHGNLLAKFIPPQHRRKNGGPSSLTRLEVLPLGHDFIDDIVISALVIERSRTTPLIPRMTLS